MYSTRESTTTDDVVVFQSINEAHLTNTRLIHPGKLSTTNTE